MLGYSPLVIRLPVIKKKVSGLQDNMGGRDNDQSLTFQPKNYLKERQNRVLSA